MINALVAVRKLLIPNAIVNGLSVGVAAIQIVG